MSNVATNCLSLQSILVCSHFAFCSDALAVASVVYFFVYYFWRDFNFERKGEKKHQRGFMQRSNTLQKHLYLPYTHLSVRLKVSITMPLGWKENIMLILLPACSDGYRKLVITLQSTRPKKNKDGKNHCDSKHHKSVVSARLGDKKKKQKTKATLRCYGLFERRRAAAARLRGSSVSEISLQSLRL